MLFGIAADMPPQDITPERLADLLKVAECGDIEGWRLDFITALRELERHRAARNADTWPMCDADAERMEKAAEALERRTAHRDELGEIVRTWLAYCDHAGIDEDAERHPDNPELNPVKALCERSRAALARQS